MARRLAPGQSQAENVSWLVPAFAAAVFFCIASGLQAQAPPSTALRNLSRDPFTNTSSQHATEVEPDTFSFGSTIVAAYQTGRFNNGGSSDIGYATSLDGGATWTYGFLPGITNVQASGNPYDRDSDPAVAYDPKHGFWLVSSLPIVDSGASIPAVIVSSSTDGINWNNPVSVTSPVTSSDKDWIVCDTWSASPYYGNCYVEWDNPAAGDQVMMSTSTDGGQTWGTGQHPANAFGLGGQPVVQPNGTVVVPFEGNGIQVFTSTNGGTSWTKATTVSTISDHFEAGNIRSGPLPSAAVDGGGTVYVTWGDCRFRAKCAENDIVISTSTDGVTWTSPARVPEDPVTSTVDHFIPGLDVDKTTSGSSAHLALTYYQYPQTSCSFSNCNLEVAYISSTNGGATWSRPILLAQGMHLSWLANTTLGYMVGDYISTSFSNGKAFGVFAVAQAKTGTTYHEAMYTTASGLSVDQTGPQFSSAGEKPIPGAKSDHGPRKEQGERGPHPPSRRLRRVADK
ncbi:MAG TPA: sialidase family protein [Terriglobia bacterium]|nr:sialidase family protein [Terriglobia bacterium]